MVFKDKSSEKVQKALKRPALSRAAQRQANAVALLSAGGQPSALQAGGNLAVQQLVKSGEMPAGIQCKLAISQPGDPAEQVADQVADQVMSMAEPGAIGSAEGTVQRKCAVPQASPAHPQIAGLADGGQPLPAAVRRFFEPRFGWDLSHVRVHTDGQADKAARAIQARAFAVGKDIVFSEGQYAPASIDGKRLLAHELTHIIQQQSERQPVHRPGPGGDTHSPNSRGSVSIRQAAQWDLNHTAGNKTVQRWPWSKAKTPERAAYEQARADLQDYRKGNHPDGEQHITFSGLGSFDAHLNAAIETLFVTVMVRFTFLDETYQKVDEEDLARILANKEQRAPRLISVVERWNPAEQEEWKRRFMTLGSSTWSFKHTLYCHKDWWEDLKARVVATFVDAKDVGQAVGVTVHKGTGVVRSNVRMGANAELNQGDIEGAHPVAAHESGHMFGLGDEYREKGAPDDERAGHSAMVKAEFGHEVIRGQADPDSIMAGAGAQKVLPEHGVVFLEAIRQATKMAEWHLSPKPPKPVPPE